MNTIIDCYSRILQILAITALLTVAVIAQATEFTYQGNLKNGGSPASGNFDFEFAMFDSVTGGSQVGSTLTRSTVTVAEGNFSVKLDFGNQYPGANRFVEVRVRQTGGGAFTPLSPRQAVNSAPYAVRSTAALSADSASTALNSSQLGGLPAAQYVTATDPRLTDARNPLPNSGNYIQNTTNPQAASNFNISGSGTAAGTLSGNMINAATQFNLGGLPIIRQPGTSNLFVGWGTGNSSTGGSNAFFGFSAGNANTTGGSNSFFGSNVGHVNTTGFSNSFFGQTAGVSNTTGNSNSFFGNSTGYRSVNGGSNAFFGANSGFENTTGNRNSFFGTNAGNVNTTGNNNTAIGYDADVAAGDLSFATALGSGAVVSSSNTVVLGRVSDTVQIPGSLISANTTSSTILNALTQFNLGGARILSTGPQDGNLFVGIQAGNANTSGFRNSFFGKSAGVANTTGANNAFYGHEAGNFNSTGELNTFFGVASGYSSDGDANTFVGAQAGFNNGTGNANTALGYLANVSNNNLSYATAIGAESVVSTSNTVVLGRSSDTVRIPGNLGVGTTAPNQRLHVVGNGIFIGNLGIGTTAPSNRLHIAAAGGNVILGDPGCDTGFAGIGFASTLSGCSNYSLLGNGTDTIISRPSGSIEFRLGNLPQAGINPAGLFSVVNLGAAGSNTLCRNASNQISTCSSSLRYKTNLNRFSSGLELVKQLTPITFDWIDGGMHDLGLGAEAVAAIEPLLVTYNDKGLVEGVKYDRIGVVLINAVREQQAQIEAQQKMLEQQRAEIEALKVLVCAQNPGAAICTPER